MNLTFLMPLSAAIVLFILSILILRAFLKTRLITLVYLFILPLSFGIWMMGRTFLAASPPPPSPAVDLFQINRLCYIIVPIFLAMFVDLTAKGNYSWKSIIASFYAGALVIGALFIDKYEVGYILHSGWVQTRLYQPIFYMFLYAFYLLLAIPILEKHLLVAYFKNKGENKELLKKINIVFLISIFGVFIFNGLRTMRMIDYPFINSLDTLFFGIGFGYLSWQYLKRPYLFHLDLIDVQLYGLYAFDNNGPLLYSYAFQPKGVKEEDKELVASALAGIDGLFKEILSGDQPLTEVRQKSNLIILERGKGITCGLVTNMSTLMTRNWLYQFRIDFEKEFSESLKKYFEFKIVEFENKPDKLIKRIFFYQ
ncbi:MAG: hypothetical protein HWN67_02680 [Candidatus Helarchaeota archaeon]|nr:hypothetical protein [Candidatus Helarchaeota archaeon]